MKIKIKIIFTIIIFCFTGLHCEEDSYAEAQQVLESVLETILGPKVFDLSGYYHYSADSGVYGEGELNDKVRITLINGVLNLPEDRFNTLEIFSINHARVNIHYIFRAFEGWSRDIIRCFVSKTGIISEEAIQLAQLWKELIAEMGGIQGGGTIVHYAHSIGGTDTFAAKNLLSPEELRMIKVYTLGSPTLIPHGEFGHVINFVSRRDGVSLLDVINFFGGLFEPTHHIVYLDTFLGLPFVDHTIASPTYTAVIHQLGQRFIEEYQ